MGSKVATNSPDCDLIESGVENLFFFNLFFGYKVCDRNSGYSTDRISAKFVSRW